MQILTYTKALADSTRLRLAALLARHELNVGEIVTVLGLAQPRVSHHLKVLTNAGLINFRRDGLWIFYSGAKSGRAARLLRELGPFWESEEVVGQDLAAAERLVEERARASRRFFDTIAPDWRRLAREVLGDFDLPGALAERLPGCALAADLGCGPGETLERLAGIAPRLIGVDHSPAMLDQARRRFAPDRDVSLRIGELEHLPLRDNEADCAVVSLTLHHLADPGLGLAEAARVLAPGGTLVVAEYDRHQREQMRQSHGDRWLGFDPAEVGGWLAAAGLVMKAEETIDLDGGLRLVLFTAEKPTNDNT